MDGVANISSQLEILRNSTSEDTFRDAISYIGMHLVDVDQRAIFRKCDGVTTIVTQLQHCWEEQRLYTQENVARECTAFGFT